MLREHVEAISRGRTSVLPPRKSCLDFPRRTCGAYPKRRGAIVSRFYLRKSRASGSTRRKVDSIIAQCREVMRSAGIKVIDSLEIKLGILTAEEAKLAEEKRQANILDEKLCDFRVKNHRNPTESEKSALASA
ncbi:MAG: hypothetical protein ACLQAH_16785 [Limisphaerales bacterium]